MKTSLEKFESCIRTHVCKEDAEVTYSLLLNYIEMKARHLATRKSIRHRNNNYLMELFVYDKQQQLPTAIFICNYLVVSLKKALYMDVEK